MRESREAFTAVSCCTTLLNKTGTWRTQRPVFEAKISSCRSACPAGNNIPEWLGLVKEGELQKAWEVITETNPLVFTCGSVCPHPCEAACNRDQFDEPLSIREIERFLGAEAIKNNWLPQKVADSKEDKVAIIGSGPAGLTAAYGLAKVGYGVTIFEALAIPGGMLAVGIPEYRLPKQALQTEIETIQKLGVEIKLNSPIGKGGLTLDELWKQGYKAIFIALGAHSSMKLNIPGEDLKGVYHGVSFLKEVNLGKEVTVGERVAIVGGGNVAIDAARTALRLGSREVSIIYRRTRQEMPASEEEIGEAEEEDIKIHYLAAPVRILGKDGKVVGMECVRMELGEPDASGRRRPLPIEGSESVIDVDMVVPAIGEVPDLSLLSEDSKLQISGEGTFEVDAKSLATNIPGVFAGGDAATGPATVIEAIAAGSKAARSLERYLRGEPLTIEDEAGRVVEFEELNLDYFKHQPRQVQIGDHLSAGEEAGRCFSCGYCNLCGNCWVFCPDIAVSRKEEGYEIDYDYCKGCGICVEECPTKSMGLKKE